MSQQHYNNWVETTSANQQDNLCGGRNVSTNELYFINKYAKKSILDIGCGTGHRTFPIWLEKKLNFYGIEKFQKLIDASLYKDKILHSDISNPHLIETIRGLSTDKFDIAFLFGGVVNGMIENELQESTWKNMNHLLDQCNFILFDTLTQFTWFLVAETGKEERLFQSVPTQYFYSKRQIDMLNKENEIEISEEKSEHLGHLIRTHYLLKRKEN